MKRRKPIYLLTPSKLRAEHGLSWYRIARAVDQGRIVPYACTGDNQGNAVLFHPDQLEQLRGICANKARRRWMFPDTASVE